MDTPNFILHPVTETEKKIIILLLKGRTIKEIAELTGLTFQGAQSQINRIRHKMHTTTSPATVARMIALGIISKEELLNCISTDWDKYIIKTN